MYRNVCIFLLFGICGLAFSAPKGPNDWTRLDEECFAESGVDSVEYEKFLKDPKIENFFDNNKSCYYLCLGKKSGEVNADGTLNVQTVLTDRTENIISPFFREMANKCSNKTGDNPCDTMKKTIECMFHLIIPSETQTP